MKRIAMITALLLAVTIPVIAQSRPSGVAQIAPGALLERGGKSSFAIYAGGNPFVFYKDTIKGVYWFNRDGYFYSNRLGGDSLDVQAAVAWVLTSKEFVLPKSKIVGFLTIGGGVLHQFKDSTDITSVGFKLESGLRVFGSIEAAVGCDYFPRQNRGDVAFVYGMLSIRP